MITMLCTKMSVSPRVGDVADLQAGVSDLQAGVSDLKSHVMILSLKIDSMESLITDQHAVGSVRDVLCGSDGMSTDRLSAAVNPVINPVCRMFVDIEAYQEPVHDLKDILRRSKPPRGKPRWK